MVRKKILPLPPPLKKKKKLKKIALIGNQNFETKDAILYEKMTKKNTRKEHLLDFLM